MEGPNGHLDPYTMLGPSEQVPGAYPACGLEEGVDWGIYIWKGQGCDYKPLDLRPAPYDRVIDETDRSELSDGPVGTRETLVNIPKRRRTNKTQCVVAVSM